MEVEKVLRRSQKSALRWYREKGGAGCDCGEGEKPSSVGSWEISYQTPHLLCLNLFSSPQFLLSPSLFSEPQSLP